MIQLLMQKFTRLLIVLWIVCTNIQAQEQKPVSIIMYGNSITWGGKWEEVLGRSDVANRGVPGYTSGQLIWTIKNILHDHPGTKIWFIEGGINDISLGIPVDRIFENIKLVIDSLRRNQIIPVVHSTILKCDAKEDNKKVVALNRKVSRYCLRNGVDYIDLNAFLARKGELIRELSTDCCHLVPEAYIPWGNAVKEVLKKYGI